MRSARRHMIPESSTAMSTSSRPLVDTPREVDGRALLAALVLRRVEQLRPRVPETRALVVVAVVLGGQHAGAGSSAAP